MGAVGISVACEVVETAHGPFVVSVLLKPRDGGMRGVDGAVAVGLVAPCRPVLERVGIGVAHPRQVCRGSCGTSRLQVSGLGTVGVVETDGVPRNGDVRDGEREVGSAVGEIGVETGGRRELGAVTVGREIGLAQLSRLLVAVGRRTENPYLVEILLPVISCIAVETGVDAVDEQPLAGQLPLESLVLVAVLHHIELFRVGAGETVSDIVGSAVGHRVDRISAGSGDKGDAVEPVAVLILHIGEEGHTVYALR